MPQSRAESRRYVSGKASVDPRMRERAVTEQRGLCLDPVSTPNVHPPHLHAHAPLLEAHPCNAVSTLGGLQSVEWVGADERVVDMALLQSRDPILYYDDLSLYEDELHDHGLVSLTVKARVMPKYDTHPTTHTYMYLLIFLWKCGQEDVLHKLVMKDTMLTSAVEGQGH